MRAVLLAVCLITAPLAAQSRSDTTAIKRVTTDRGEVVSNVRIAADTAWAVTYLRDKVTDIHTGSTRGQAVQLRITRLERRRGRWVVTSVLRGPTPRQLNAVTDR
jgi:hypothetical protein